MITKWLGFALLEHMPVTKKLTQLKFRTYDNKANQNKKGLRKRIRKT